MPLPSIDHIKNKAAEVVEDNVPVHLYRTPTSPGLSDPGAASKVSIMDEVLNKSDLELDGPDGPLYDKSQDDLVSQIIHQSDDYRFITFNIPKDVDNLKHTGNSYKKRVAFDTINLQVARDRFDFDDDNYSLPLENKKYSGEFNLNLFDGNRGRESIRSPSPNARSPIHSPLRNNSMSSFYMAPRLDYPTTPIITHRGCTYSRVHKDFKDLYAMKLFNKENGYLKPILPLRTILVYISGRKHTWVALDWILNKFIEQGDTVVIVAAINHQLGTTRKSGYHKKLPQGISPRARSRNKPENIKVIAQNIMKYALEVVNPNIIAKISIELALGKSREVLKEMYKLYEPNLVSTGSKANLKRSAPLKSWTSSKISDRLVKNSPLPIIVVPAMKMNDFEDQLAVDINNRYFAGKKISRRSTLSSSRNSEFSNSVNRSEEPQTEDDDYSDTGSDTSSIDSDLSVESESYSAYDEISKLYEEYKQTVSKNLKHSRAQPIDENYFANCLKVVSDESTYLCQEIRNINPGFQGKGSNLAKAITGSNSFGVIPYKAKSLLIPEEEPEGQNASQSPGPPSLSYKELKRNLKLNAQKNHTNAPQIHVEEAQPNDNSSSLSRPPKTSALKFVDLEKPSKDRDRNTSRPHKLGKSLSHEIDSSTSRPNIEQSRSHPDLTAVGHVNIKDYDDKEDKKKKKRKKKRFLGLF